MASSYSIQPYQYQLFDFAQETLWKFLNIAFKRSKKKLARKWLRRERLFVFAPPREGPPPHPPDDTPRANTRRGSIFQSIIETEIVREAAGALGLVAAAGASRVLMDG